MFGPGFHRGPGLATARAQLCHDSGGPNTNSHIDTDMNSQISFNNMININISNHEININSTTNIETDTIIKNDIHRHIIINKININITN
jgi:hypothetical protein